ncbi:hypothetical protein OSSY52_19430 [Tepiditoga spiralis]|uniref:Uncharacterized protein n=1 Tax=Tepiditoga spiralis TaxID=2108365 RepID=A0A7G1GBL2_9BACT|nr:hypothetical protein [Tepiditoga spiralis]BBE31802.1 hypothetical protein OSSY52_19430 [Tepiditoga spiralis]
MLEYKNLDMIIKFDEKDKKAILLKNNNEIIMDIKQIIGSIVIFREILEKIKDK